MIRTFLEKLGITKPEKPIIYTLETILPAIEDRIRIDDKFAIIAIKMYQGYRDAHVKIRTIKNNVISYDYTSRLELEHLKEENPKLADFDFSFSCFTDPDLSLKSNLQRMVDYDVNDSIKIREGYFEYLLVDLSDNDLANRKLLTSTLKKVELP